MGTDAATDVVERLVEAFHARDREAFDACYADPIVVHASSGESRTMSLDEHWDEVEAMFASFPDLHARIDHLVSGDGHVFLRGSYTATYEGARYPSAAGRRATWAWWCDYRIQAGRVVEAWNCYDELALYQQLGLWEEPSP